MPLILRNSFSLLIVQGTNFLLPLIILPHLIKTLGLEKFGMVSFAQALMSYFIIFIDYGYNLLATREIAISKNDPEAITNIVSTTLITKLFLLIVAFVVLLLIVSNVDSLSDNAALYYISFFLVMGQALMPTWFFQGLEKMNYLTYANFFSKFIFTLLIFMLVKSENDFVLVTFFLSLGNIVSGLFSIYIMHTKFKVRLIFPKDYQFKMELVKGGYAFLSNFSINAYINSNLVILAFFASPIIVGYYSIADKVIYALRQLLNIFFQAVYPRVCTLATQGIIYVKDFFKKLFPALFLITLLMCIVCFVLAKIIIQVTVGGSVSEPIYLLQLVSFIPIIICLNIPAFQTLLAYNFQKSYMVVLVTGSLLNIVLNIFLAKTYYAYGTIIATAVTETFITIGLHLALKFKHKKYSFI